MMLVARGTMLHLPAFGPRLARRAATQSKFIASAHQEQGRRSKAATAGGALVGVAAAAALLLGAPGASVSNQLCRLNSWP